MGVPDCRHNCRHNCRHECRYYHRHHRAWSGGLLAGLLVLILAGCGGVSPLQRFGDAELAEWERDTRQWRRDREERLTAPYGWLSLVGLEPLPEGRHRVGAGADNDIILPVGPSHWGVLVNDNGSVVFITAPGVNVTVDGRLTEQAALQLTGPDGPTPVQSGTLRFHLVERMGGLAIRLRDSEAESRRDFAGLRYFPIQPGWRIEGRFEAHQPPQTIPVANVLGELIDQANPGAAVFTMHGREFRLEAIGEPDADQLFFIFADRTSGRETYGLGRFLYADWPVDGTIVLDFNRAYNPPCAFNAHTTCPLPPPENRLDLPVTAGERTYRGTPGIDPDELGGL